MAHISKYRLKDGTYRYRGHKDPRTALRMRIREIAQTRVRYGYRKIVVLLNREGLLSPTVGLWTLLRR